MNILIVDDQKQVVQGILSGIPWREISEIRDVFSACTAREARHIFVNHTIDLIISDIEMPGENGIELVHWVRDHFPETLCIFLTAHANFDYAQNAIRLNCVDYILQPVRYDVLRAAIEKAVLLLVERQKEQELMNHNIFWNTHRDELELQIWLEFLQGDTASADITGFLDKASRLNLSIPVQSPYVLLLIGQTLSGSTLDELADGQSLQTLKQLAQDFFAPVQGYQCLIEREEQQFLYLFSTDTTEDTIQTIVQTFVDMCQNQYDIHPAVYFGYAGGPGRLPGLYQKLLARKAQNIAAYPGLFSCVEPPEAACGAMPSTQNWSDYFVRQITDPIRNSIQSCIERSTAAGTMNSMTLLTLQQYFILSFHTSLKMRSVRFRTVMEQEGVFEAFAVSTRSVEDFYHFIDTIFQINRTLSKEEQTDPASLIETAQDYIARHIASGELSRQSIAADIHVSESYLSHLFQKQTGLSLTDYIVSQRMKLGRSLILETTMPISLVAAKTGYNSASYFIRAFRKEYGMTPSEYRKREKERG